uniref:Ribosome maturation factor RimM n=1 Tax=Prevotella sp. GTC17259 TaxID=3236795 RepID=A0AB33JCR3_9BACT
MIKAEEVYKIGRIGKPHGVKGEVSMSFSDDVFDRVEADYLVLEIEGILVPFFMEEYRFHGEETALVKFCDIDTQEQARQLTGSNVFFPRYLSDSDAENVTWAEIIGWTVRNSNDGAVAGKIQHVDDSTINTLFEVVTPDGREVLIPASDDLIAGIDHDRHEISLAIPEGIMGLE